MYTAIRDALEKNTCVISLGVGRSTMVLTFDIQIMTQTKKKDKLGLEILLKVLNALFTLILKYLQQISVIILQYYDIITAGYANQ